MVRSNNVDYKPKERAADAAVEVRRSVTFYPEVNTQMLMIRGALFKQGISIDHTKMMNALLKLGIKMFPSAVSEPSMAYILCEYLGLKAKNPEDVKKIRDALARAGQDYIDGMKLIKHVAETSTKK